jgi:hypothetical protein
MKGMNLGGIFMAAMLCEDDSEERRKLLTFAAKRAHEPLPTSFVYVDMSPAALRGPPIAALAFAGIAVRPSLML